jgi:hypothetical protein
MTAPSKSQTSAATEKPPDPANEKAALAGGSLKTGNYDKPIPQERSVNQGLAGRTNFLDPLQAIGPEVKNGELFVDLRKIIDAGLEPECPSVAEILPGKPLLYPGRLNEIHSEPGLGKTNIGLIIAPTAEGLESH